MRDIDRIMGALSSPVRREILGLIWRQELAAGEIAATFDVTKPTISQHLAVLREAGLVTMTAAGTSRRYRVRREALSGLHAALENSLKWEPADDIPEMALSETRNELVVVAAVDVDTDQSTTFAAFTNAGVYSRWLGVPVTIKGGRFAATMEWGTEVRGTYEVVCPPDLIAMRWDFEDNNIPIPGREMIGYLRVQATASGGAHVEVHQLVATPEQAEFMRAAWGLVLGRLREGVVAASNPAARTDSRAPRPKRRNSP